MQSHFYLNQSALMNKTGKWSARKKLGLGIAVSQTVNTEQLSAVHSGKDP